MKCFRPNRIEMLTGEFPQWLPSIVSHLKRGNVLPLHHSAKALRSQRVAGVAPGNSGAPPKLRSQHRV
jgi:hypothetical protein